MIAEYLTRGVQTQTANLGLTKLANNLTDPIVDAVNANAVVLDSAAVIVAAPATATSAGRAGQIAFDSTHFYLCVETNVWVRATLATF